MSLALKFIPFLRSGVYLVSSGNKQVVFLSKSVMTEEYFRAFGRFINVPNKRNWKQVDRLFLLVV